MGVHITKCDQLMDMQTKSNSHVDNKSHTSAIISVYQNMSYCILYHIAYNPDLHHAF